MHTVTYLMISYETEEVAAGGEHKENQGGEDQGTGTQGKYGVTYCETKAQGPRVNMM